MNQTVCVNTIHVNLSPDAFHMYARHYYKCKQDFQCPDKFSPVPYFLLCRAIELEIKAKHLASKRQSLVKKEYGHDLMKAYNSLSPGDRILSSDEVDILSCASQIYKGKGFEYFMPQDALRGYSNYPDLDLLDSVARKIIGDGV